MRQLVLVLLLVVLSYAKTVTASFTYALGDRDTKIEAKKIAFAEAKRMAIENIGVWIKTETNIVNGELASDKINSFVMGYAKTKIISETFVYPKYTITIELTIDEAELRKSIPQEKNDEKEKVVEIEQKEEKIAPIESDIQEMPSSSSKLYNTEIGTILGSGSLNIKEENADDVKESIGFGALKVNYYFTKNHAVEFIAGGGSTKVNEEELKINTISFAYLYRFDSVKDDQFFPFLALGLVSGNAVFEDGTPSERTYEGSGGMFHAGCKWVVSRDRHHIIEAGLLVQSFNDDISRQITHDDDEDDDEEYKTKQIPIEFGISQLAFGYSYSF